MKTNVQVSQRIAMLRTFMIFGVVLLHTPGHVELNAIDGSNLFYLVRAFVQDALFRVGVPVLSLISGYLLFGANLDQTPLKLYKKKFKTLGVPFLVFNVGLASAVYAFQAATGHVVWRDLAKMDHLEVANMFFSLTDSPINYPLYFLRDVLVCVLLAPVMGGLIRRTHVMGAIAVSYIFMNDLDGQLVLRATIPMMMYVGGVAAVYNWNLQALDRYAKQCAVVFFLLCASIIAFRMTNRFYITTIAPFFLWPAASLLVNTKFGMRLRKMSDYSFFVFCAHAPLLLVVSMFYQHVAAHVPEWLFWISAPTLTIGALMGVYNFATAKIPTLFGWATGARAKPVGFVERRRYPRAANAPVLSHDDRAKLINF